MHFNLKVLMLFTAGILLISGLCLAQDKANRSVTIKCDPLRTPNFEPCHNGEFLTVTNKCEIGGVPQIIKVGWNGNAPADVLAFSASIAYGCTNPLSDCYTVQVVGPRGRIETSEGCAAPGGTEIIPTLSEWGMIIFSLLILTLITVVVARRRTAGVAAGTGGDVSISGPMFIPQVFVKTLTVTLGLAAVVLVAAGLLSQSLPLRDIAGTIISAGIIAYMAHLWVQPRRKG